LFRARTNNQNLLGIAKQRKFEFELRVKMTLIEKGSHVTFKFFESLVTKELLSESHKSGPVNVQAKRDLNIAH
jgi:hypothetical protein